MLCGRISDTSLISSAPVLTGVGESIAKAKSHIPFVYVSFDDQEGQEMESYALSLDSYVGVGSNIELSDCAHGQLRNHWIVASISSSAVYISSTSGPSGIFAYQI